MGGGALPMDAMGSAGLFPPELLGKLAGGSPGADVPKNPLLAEVIKDQSRVPGAVSQPNFPQDFPEKNPAFHDDLPRTPQSFDAKPTTNETVPGRPLAPGEQFPPRPPVAPPVNPLLGQAVKGAQVKDNPDLIEGVLAAQGQPAPTNPLLAADGEAPVQAQTEHSAPAIDATPAAGKERQLRTLHGLFDGGFGDGLKTVQGALKDAPYNPLFRAGIGLASAGYSGGDPYAGVMGGLTNIPQLENERLKAQKTENELEQQASEKQLAALLAAIGQKYNTPENEGGSRIARGAAKVIR
jgi:hypothetical protein